MRPLRLEMQGFGAYRDATVVDFTDVDLFALSGPTGAGKSTIIDAICVALYGAVPRYDDLRTIAPIISQGMNQATVRLTFSVDGVEHSATRLIVRTKAGGNTKEARLERGDVVLAGNADEVRAAVTDLLGLTFEHFTRCVVLPQGDFAQFLHDKPKERQDLLKRLLGIEIYEQIAAAARARGSVAQAQRVAAEQQLDDLAAYTPDRRADLDVRTATLAKLAGEVEIDERTITSLERQIVAVQAERTTVDAQIGLLRAVDVPDGVAQLEHDLDEAERQHVAAVDALAVAESAVEERRSELDALGDLGQLEAARALIAQLRDLAPITAQVRSETAGRLTELEMLRDELTDVERELDESRARGQQLDQQLAQHIDAVARLGTIEVPTDLDAVCAAAADLDAQIAVAAAAEATVRDQLGAAEAAPVPDADRLASIRVALDAVDQLDLKLAGLDADRLEAARLVSVASAARDAASERSVAARATLAAVELADRAGAMRHHLVEGEACPVCLQTVAHLPVVAANADLDAARAAVADADSESAAAAAELDRADRALASFQTQMLTLQHELERARTETGGVSRDELSAQQATADRNRHEIVSLRRELGLANDRVEALRTQRRDADADLQRLARELVKATTNVRDLHPPEPDATDVRAGWHSLATWSASTTREQEAALQVTQGADATERRRGDELRAAIVARCGAAGIELAERQAASAAAHGEAQRVRAELAAIDEKLARGGTLRDELAAIAASHPLHSAEAADIDARIGQIRGAQAALEQSDTVRRSASGVLTAARTELDVARTALTSAEQRYTSAFAAVAALGAPAGDDASLAQRWAALAGWASTELPRLRARAGELDGEAKDARDEIERRQHQLVAVLTELDVPTRGGQRASAAVAAAIAVHEAAVAEFDRQVQRRDELALRVEAMGKEEAVASQLGRLLDARNFEKWLLDDVLRQLVEGATDRLLDLSGQQYSLAYDRGDFLVVDHRNADQTRSARTLSGGETFLASLALALSLADQLATFSTGKTAMLEALFLDEGFGTLDPDTLDIVAAAIEELGSQGRMIGVVSHVAELAERVPVRYVVTKQGNAASVTRVLQ